MFGSSTRVSTTLFFFAAICTGRGGRRSRMDCNTKVNNGILTTHFLHGDLSSFLTTSTAQGRFHYNNRNRTISTCQSIRTFVYRRSQHSHYFQTSYCDTLWRYSKRNMARLSTHGAFLFWRKVWIMHDACIHEFLLDTCFSLETITHLLTTLYCSLI